MGRALTVLALLFGASTMGVLAFRAIGEGNFGLTVLFGMLAFVFTAGAAHTLRDRN